MAKRNRAAESTKPGMLREEVRLRREQARFQAMQVGAARKQLKAALSTYGAASKGRGNRDWFASNASADMAIIPDSLTLNARARQAVRDSWPAKSIVRSMSRNVVGCGILPIPLAKDKDGKFLREVNKRALKLFWAWAKDFKHCDVEGRQTFWQKQALMVEERFTVGEAFLAWVYQPAGKRKVGLRFQSFEPDQLDLRLQSFTDPATGLTHQVRGGVEVDEFGAAVAYHFYTRNPNDYLPVSWNSVRIPAARVFHYFKQERVMQVRGVTPLAPILQEVRDFNRFRQATLWRAIMEACIGMVIKKTMPGGGNPLGVQMAPGSDTTTQQGKRLIDFTPGMVPELNEGEDLTPLMPSTPGSQYEPFTKSSLRGMGAGVGLSYGQVARQSEGSYSSARQDMLEDRKEFEPEQELAAHIMVLPIYELLFKFSVLEGKFDDLLKDGEFEEDPERFLESDYVAPAAPWIDPEKEANAFEKLLKLKVISRSEIAALRGHRLDDIWDTIQSEDEKAEEMEIDLAIENPNAKAPQPQPGEKQANADDAVAELARRLAVAGKSTPPPHYRDGDDVMRCGTCSYLLGSQCKKFNVEVEEGKVCDAWEAKPVSRSDSGGAGKLAPWKPDGEKPLDRQFQSDAATRDVGTI